jgi:hypothetical protein
VVRCNECSKALHGRLWDLRLRAVTAIAREGERDDLGAAGEARALGVLGPRAAVSEAWIWRWTIDDR